MTEDENVTAKPVEIERSAQDAAVEQIVKLLEAQSKGWFWPIRELMCELSRRAVDEAKDDPEWFEAAIARARHRRCETYLRAGARSERASKLVRCELAFVEMLLREYSRPTAAEQPTDESIGAVLGEAMRWWNETVRHYVWRDGQMVDDRTGEPMKRRDADETIAIRRPLQPRTESDESRGPSLFADATLRGFADPASPIGRAVDRMVLASLAPEQPTPEEIAERNEIDAALANLERRGVRISLDVDGYDYQSKLAIDARRVDGTWHRILETRRGNVESHGMEEPAAP